MEKENIGLIECRIRGYLFLIILLIGGVVFCLYKQSAFFADAENRVKFTIAMKITDIMI